MSRLTTKLGNTTYIFLYWETLPERCTFFRLQLYESVLISVVEVYERVGKSVILVCKGAEKSQQAHFMDVKGCEAQLSIFMEIALYLSIIIIMSQYETLECCPHYE